MANILYVMQGSLVCNKAKEILERSGVKYSLVYLPEEQHMLPDEHGIKVLPAYKNDVSTINGITDILEHFGLK